MSFQLKGTSRKNLFLTSFINRLEGEISFPENAVPCPAAALKELAGNLKTSLPESLELLVGQEQLVNLRGRQFSGVTETQELVKIEGSLELVLPEEEDEGNEEEVKLVPVFLELVTSFDSTQRGTGIIHNLKVIASPEIEQLLPKVSLEEALQLSSVTWNSARLGLEIFKTGFFGSLLGTSPVIHKRAYLELTQQKLQFTIEDTTSGTTSASPLKEELVLEALDSFCKKRSLGRDFLDQAKKYFNN